MEQLPSIIDNKRELAKKYKFFFEKLNIDFVPEPADSKSNYWLNALILENKEERNRFLEYLNDQNVMTRPIWQLMNRLEMFKDCQTDELTNTKWLADRVVNIPSSTIWKK
jgi:dTDP-4-amino-4,6-dideoxygalactose transaminase